MNWSVFLAIYILQIYLTFPHFQQTCNTDLTAYSLYFSHHLFDIFLVWSPLFLQTRMEYIIHAIIVIGIMIHWVVYDNKCIWTVLMNRECGFPEEQWLDSLKNMLNLRQYSEYFLFVWLAIVLFYDIYHIIR